MKSIRQELTRRLLWTILLLVGGGLLAVYFAGQAALQDQFDETLLSKAMAMSTLTRQDREKIVISPFEQHLHGYAEDVASDFFQMWLPDGSVVARSSSLGGRDLPRHYSTESHNSALFVDATAPDGTPIRVIGFSFHPRQTNNELTPYESITLGLAVAAKRDELDQTLLLFRIGLAIFGTVLLAAFGLIVPRVLRQGLEPLQKLAAQAAAITADSLDCRFPVDNLAQELRPISERLNEVLSRLEESFNRERQFSANLAHELRTPLAEQRGMLELALKWPAKRNPNTDQQVLDVVLHTEGIVLRLLTLLRSEHGTLPIVWEPLALDRVMALSWRPFADKAGKRGLGVRFEAPSGLVIEADGPLLRSVLANLFDNATEYAPAGGEITVQAGLEGGRFSLCVCNTVGPNLEAADLPHLFDRFWRKEAARTGGIHTGLGLTFVRAVVLAHGWTLTANLVEPGLFRLQIEGGRAAVSARFAAADANGQSRPAAPPSPRA